MKYYIISGEASGDLHGSMLIRELKNLDRQSSFRCWGGDLMKNQGADLVKHYRYLSFMGFWEVIIHLRIILKNIRFCKQDILQYKPDALILIDYPGFNLRIAEYAYSKGIKVLYYISPQLWAWKQSRVKIIKKCVNRLFVILPFEKEFYSRLGYETDFVGHPLLDVISEKKNTADQNKFIENNRLHHKPVIAILPGSRKQEIKRILPVMIKMKTSYPEYQFVIGAVSSISRAYYMKIIGNEDIPMVYDQTHELLQYAVAALVKSGTSTLETALLNIPEVVCYKANFISYHIAKRLAKVNYISLVNLIMDKEIVKELIQNELTPENLKKELDRLLYDKKYIADMKEGFSILKEKLGGAGASERTAKGIMNYVKK